LINRKSFVVERIGKTKNGKKKFDAKIERFRLKKKFAEIEVFSPVNFCAVEFDEHF